MLTLSRSSPEMSTPDVGVDGLATESALVPSKWDRFFLPILFALLAIFIALAWATGEPGITTRQDDAIYVFLARSLLEFGYHDVYRVDAPLHNLYPPGYPLTLAALMGVFGERILLLQAFGIVVTAAGLGVLARELRVLWSSRFALLTLASLVVNPFLLSTAPEIGTDGYYMLLSLLALALVVRLNPSPGWLAAAGGVAIWASLTRSVGVTLLLAIGVYWLAERRYSAALKFAIATAVTTGLWLLWTVVSPEKIVGRSYIADATYRGAQGEAPFSSVLLERLSRNVPEYLAIHVPNRVGIPLLPGIFQVAIGAGLAIALAVGIVLLWRRWWVAALYLGLCGVLLAVWPWELARYLNVVIPLLVPVTLLGIGGMASRLHPRWGFPAIVIVGIALASIGALRTGKMLSSASGCRWGSEIPAVECRLGDQGPFFSALEYIDQHAAADAVLLTGKPAPAYYFTGRKTVPYASALRQSSDDLVADLRRYGETYVILSAIQPSERRELAPLLVPNCAELRVDAFFEPSTYVLSLNDEGSDRDGQFAGACGALVRYLGSPIPDVTQGER